MEKVRQSCLLSPCLFNLCAEHIMRNAGLDELQAGIKIGRRNINILICGWYHSHGRKQRGTKELLMKVKESERAGVRLNIKKTKILTSRSITSWQTEEEKVEVVTDFLFLGSKITAGGDCSLEIRWCLLLGRKAMTNLACWKAETLLCWQRSI